MSIFLKGETIPDSLSTYFSGVTHLQKLTNSGVIIYNVSFEKGCRNNWHVHHGGGQILLVTEGSGWYQAYGEQAKPLKPGDVVEIPAGVKHWHGAANGNPFAHLAIEIPAVNGHTEWLEPVLESDYRRLK